MAAMSLSKLSHQDGSGGKQVEREIVSKLKSQSNRVKVSPHKRNFPTTNVKSYVSSGVGFGSILTNVVDILYILTVTCGTLGVNTKII
jgi:hypothetical protein